MQTGPTYAMTLHCTQSGRHALGVVASNVLQTRSWALCHNYCIVTGNGMPDRISPAIVAQVGNLKKDEALQAMSKTHALRHPTLLAIYNYWREKRVKRGRPLLRSLQAPTAPSDSNPYNVFRYLQHLSLILCSLSQANKVVGMLCSTRIMDCRLSCSTLWNEICLSSREADQRIRLTILPIILIF